MKVPFQKRKAATAATVLLSVQVATRTSTTSAFSLSPQSQSLSSLSSLSTSSSILKSTIDEFETTSNTPKAKKDLPKFSKSIPFLQRPKELTLELAGDVGFDPFNFAKNQESLYEYREAEIKHGRLAMLASAGWVFSELFDEQIASYVGMEPLLNSNDRVPSLFNGGMEKVSPLWWGFCIGLTAAIDLYGVSRARSAMRDDGFGYTNGYKPGNLGFDPLSLYPDEDDAEGRLKMELAEIKHCRLAMIAITAFSVQEFVTNVGVIDETPFFFKPIIQTARPFLESIVNSN
jgi:hypothetical protein